MNINSSNLLSVKLHLTGLNTLPAILNRRSTGADDDGTPSTSFASIDKWVYFDEWIFQ